MNTLEETKCLILMIIQDNKINMDEITQTIWRNSGETTRIILKDIQDNMDGETKIINMDETNSII